uniref:Uncharacterized protein n=1 Tax=Anguilla anguilla TaxID=7936 RepID=A0A0E9PRY9_ANGAN
MHGFWQCPLKRSYLFLPVGVTNVLSSSS